MSYRRDQNAPSSTKSAFIYSFLVYVCLSAFKGSFPITFHVEPGDKPHYLPELHFWPLAEVTAIAVILAITVATMMNNDFPLSLFKRWGITQRTFRPSVWNDVFKLSTQYVQVELADGRNVIGWLAYFSDTPQEAALYLEDAAWLREDQVQVPINGPGILLTKESGIRTIMLLSAVETPPSTGNAA